MVYVQTFIYNFATLTPFHMGNQSQHCKNKVVKLTNLFVSTVATHCLLFHSIQLVCYIQCHMSINITLSIMCPL